MSRQVFKSRLSASDIEKGSVIKEKYLNRGGFRTGFLINMLNPTLFFGWMTSTFITMSLVTSLGFNMGGLQDSINNTLKAVENSNTHTVSPENITPRIRSQRRNGKTITKRIQGDTTTLFLLCLPFGFPLEVLCGFSC